MSNSYPSRTEIQQLLGIKSFGLRRLVRKYVNFPQPTESPHDPLAAFGSRKSPRRSAAAPGAAPGVHGPALRRRVPAGHRR
ncbi:hypothetical protein [Streptomyces sp. NEAU-sy36]|uniref:hypothetical protein n=1 Tax=Streptomyces sp. NEAU-sy36 TaxID=2751189 RepID=UPI001C57F415|nr:hypothetical protein [Streptomyces sp. NEAU-sy36]